jgi:hypothetical protein
MSVRIIVDIPEPLHKLLRERAEKTGVSMSSLILRALERTYTSPRKGQRVTGPMICGTGKRGPRFPTDENPHDLVFS